MWAERALAKSPSPLFHEDNQDKENGDWFRQNYKILSKEFFIYPNENIITKSERLLKIWTLLLWTHPLKTKTSANNNILVWLQDVSKLQMMMVCKMLSYFHISLTASLCGWRVTKCCLFLCPFHLFHLFKQKWWQMRILDHGSSSSVEYMTQSSCIWIARPQRKQPQKELSMCD